jgi:hypothetical protein
MHKTSKLALAGVLQSLELDLPWSAGLADPQDALPRLELIQQPLARPRLLSLPPFSPLIFQHAATRALAAIAPSFPCEFPNFKHRPLHPPVETDCCPQYCTKEKTRHTWPPKSRHHSKPLLLEFGRLAGRLASKQELLDCLGRLVPNSVGGAVGHSRNGLSPARRSQSGVVKGIA